MAHLWRLGNPKGSEVRYGLKAHLYAWGRLLPSLRLTFLLYTVGILIPAMSTLQNHFDDQMREVPWRDYGYMLAKTDNH